MIHPTAIIDPEVRERLPEDIRIGPYSIIEGDVSFGPGCEIGPHVVIRGPTRIGAENRFFQFASIGERPQDLKYHGEPTELVIGDRNTFRESCTVHRGTLPPTGIERTVIGNDNLFMAYTHIAHDCVIGDHVIMSNAASLAGHVTVHDHAILGGFTLVHQFCRVGEHAFTGMGTALNRDLPPFVMASGNLARPVGINKEGLKRRGFSEAAIRALHQAFRALFRSRRPDRQETVRTLAETHPEVARLLAFVEESERGVIR
ncbi:MAG TPA: acyl-ACP--UDP-N-acetylglucosamine O-acyltransferase [Chromatiales bacterium]|nr:acyl-ACP--UDP-N-acetylglucosamine O-acyltransferase [Chromatiales bacterium]